MEFVIGIGILVIAIVMLMVASYVKAPPGYSIHYLRLPETPHSDR